MEKHSMYKFFMEEMQKGDLYEFLYDPKDCTRIFIRAEMKEDDVLMVYHWEVKENRERWNQIVMQEHGLSSRDYRRI